MTHRTAFLLLSLQLLVSRALAQPPVEVAKLTPSDGAPFGIFGHALALDGDTAVVGADQHQSFLGGAYVFERNAGGPDAWSEVKKLLPPDVLPGHFFGYRVEVSGDVIVAGATKRTSSGVVYLFERHLGGPGNWGQAPVLSPADGDGNQTFGTGVDIDGDTVAVGANFASGHAGAAWVFERNRGGPEAWGETRKIQAADAAGGDEFGENLAISGDVIVVGSLFDDDNGADSIQAQPPAGRSPRPLPLAPGGSSRPAPAAGRLIVPL
jgi:FG-GAP repeat